MMLETADSLRTLLVLCGQKILVYTKREKTLTAEFAENTSENAERKLLQELRP
jgi:hypothetical protein